MQAIIKSPYGRNVPLSVRQRAENLFHKLLRQTKSTLFDNEGNKIKITDADKQVFSFIIVDSINEKTSEAFPRQQTIAEKLGFCRETVNRATQKLQRLGLIKIYAQYRKSLTKAKHGVYERRLRVANRYYMSKSLISRLVYAIKSGSNTVRNVVEKIINVAKTLKNGLKRFSRHRSLEDLAKRKQELLDELGVQLSPYEMKELYSKKIIKELREASRRATSASTESDENKTSENNNYSPTLERMRKNKPQNG